MCCFSYVSSRSTFLSSYAQKNHSTSKKKSYQASQLSGPVKFHVSRAQSTELLLLFFLKKQQLPDPGRLLLTCLDAGYLERHFY